MKPSPIVGFEQHLMAHIHSYRMDHGQAPAMIYVHMNIYKHFADGDRNPAFSQPDAISFNGCLILNHLCGDMGLMWSPI